MSGHLFLMTRELNILMITSVTSLTGLIKKYPTIGARKAEWKERPKLPSMDFIFDRGLPASRVEPSVLSEVLTSSSRLSLREWIIFDDLRSSCPSIPLRRSRYKMDVTFGGVFPAYHHGCTFEDNLQRSSSRLRSGEAYVLTWHSFPIRIGGLCSH